MWVFSLISHSLSLRQNHSIDCNSIHSFNYRPKVIVKWVPRQDWCQWLKEKRKNVRMKSAHHLWDLFHTRAPKRSSVFWTQSQRLFTPKQRQQNRNRFQHRKRQCNWQQHREIHVMVFTFKSIYPWHLFSSHFRRYLYSINLFIVSNNLFVFNVFWVNSRQTFNEINF